MSKKLPIPKNAHICKALLAGHVLTIMDGFHRWSVTNLPRELSRSIEQKFDIRISRDRVDFTTDMGLPGWYYRYRLNFTQDNEEGIERMKQYISEYFPKKEETTLIKQSALF